MRRYILTGAPGSGKTSVLTELAAAGHAVVAEAATDVIAAEQSRGGAEPWLAMGFTERIAELQRARQLTGVAPASRWQFFDRSPVCTLALARYLGHRPGVSLSAELSRLAAEPVYAKDVFFIRPIGFIEATAARRISYAESLEFELLHEAAYREFGFRLIDIQPASPAARASQILSHVTSDD
jgi:predicted ATPase